MPARQKNDTIVKTATIATGATTSGAISLAGMKVFALSFGTMTGTAMTFTASDSPEGTFRALYDDAGNAISLTIASDRVVGVTSNAASMALAGCNWIKLVSGSTEAAEREITLLGRA